MSVNQASKVSPASTEMARVLVEQKDARKETGPAPFQPSGTLEQDELRIGTEAYDALDASGNRILSTQEVAQGIEELKAGEQASLEKAYAQRTDTLNGATKGVVAGLAGLGVGGSAALVSAMFFWSTPVVVGGALLAAAGLGATFYANHKAGEAQQGFLGKLMGALRG